MAKYTMLLTEYLESGGKLPALFNVIDGFEATFILKYCASEIGFETPYLFECKLESIARLYIQVYADKIAHLAQAWLHFDAPIKTYYTKENKTFSAGAQHGATTELPLDASSAEPSMTTDTDAYENKEGRGETREEKGETHEEVERAIEFLNRDIEPLIEQLLEKFKLCFMVVY